MSGSSVVIAGGPNDFMAARHLRIEGSQRDIGRALAEESVAAFPAVPVPTDPVLNRARRRWMERSWPQHFGRMRGIADVLGIDVDDDSANAVDLYAMPIVFGCSALCSPAVTSTDGHARIGRNFDFFTGSVLELAGAPRDPGQPPMMSRPYVIETRPDDAPSSVVIAVGDFTGCMEGINGAGLVVALFADDESEDLRPSNQAQAGLHELQLSRFLLDTCTTVDEAVQALYTTKQYDNFIVCHYLVSDASGDTIVWERDHHNAEHVVRADGGPFCVTNYLLHRYESIAALPEHDRHSVGGEIPFRTNAYERARTLYRHGERATLSIDDIDAALAAVQVDGETTDARTLWYSRYDLAERSMTVEFYLGDHPDGSPRRSSPFVCAA